MKADLNKMIQELNDGIENSDGIRMRELTVAAWASLYHLKNFIEVQKQKFAAATDKNRSAEERTR